MKQAKLFLLMMAVLALNACASTNSFRITSSNFEGGEVIRASEDKQPSQKVATVEIGDNKKVVNLSTDPYSTLGLLKTKAIAENRFTAVEGIVPDVRFGEYFPGSIGGKCWAVAEGGKEYFCQTILYRLGEDGFFRSAYIIDASQNEVAKTKVMALSIRGDYVYDLYGKEFLADKKIYEDEKVRREFVEKNGTPAVSVPLVLDLDKIIGKWNEYSTPEGILLSPLGSEEVKFIAGINPQYSFADKLIGTGNFTLKPDPIGMMAGFAIDVLRSSQAPATGWDYNSQLPSRRNMALIIQYVSEMKQMMFLSLLEEKEKFKVVVANKNEESKKKEEKVKTDFKAEDSSRAVNSSKKVEIEKNSISSKSSPNPKRGKIDEYFSKSELEVRALQENIQKLGYPKQIALGLAKKIKNRESVSITFPNNGTLIAKSVLKNGEVIVGPARLRLNNKEQVSFIAEKYEEGGHYLYRVYTTFQTLFKL